MAVEVVGKLLNLCVCRLILVLLCILYAGPMIFDIFPSSDSYIGGIGFLGVWGVVFAILLGSAFSIFYGFNCVSDKTVYRCALFGCNKKNKGLLFPAKFPEELKNQYINNVSFDENNNPIPNGFSSHFPLSKFNRTLRKLNNDHLYREGDEIKVIYDK